LLQDFVFITPVTKTPKQFFSFSILGALTLGALAQVRHVGHG